MFKLIVDIGSCFLLYILPLIVSVIYCVKSNISKRYIVILCVIYIVLVILTSEITYNTFPFIITIFNIVIISKHNDQEFKSFKLMKGIKYSVISYLICIFASVIYIQVVSKFNINLETQKIVKDLSDFSIFKFIIMMPIIMVFAPVLEEFIFRWVLFEKLLKDKIGVVLAAILSSGLFAIAHYNLSSFGVLFMIGLINCWLVRKKGYWYAVINHGFFNSISVLALLYTKLK